MKYLKLYESDNYYTEINPSYAKNGVGGIQYVALSKKEVDIITELVKNTNGRWSFSKTEKTLNFQSGKASVLSKSETHVGIRFIGVVVDFLKINDEYYIISLYDREDDCCYCYKCDQLDGLKKCIEERINWRIERGDNNFIYYQQELRENQSWSTITTSTYYDFDKVEKFTSLEWIKINEVFSSDYPQVSTTIYQSPIYKVFDVKINDEVNEIKLLYYSKSGLSNNRFIIYKLPDEWFFVVDPNRSSFYKCDQLDGLIDCLKKNFYV